MKKKSSHTLNINLKVALCNIVLLILIESEVFSQQANNWYFYSGAGITFNTAPPTALIDGQSNDKGTACVSDENGALLFYSDATQVWNRQQQIMPNGTGLFGSGSVAGGNYSTAIQYPGNSNLYYLFTCEVLNFPPSGYSGYFYSTIDKRLNNGLGGIVEKNKLITRPSGERMTTVQHRNGIESWLVTLERGNLIYNTFKIGCSGISAFPVKDSFELRNQVDSFYYLGSGDMKTSFQNDKIANSFYLASEGRIELYRFNNSTGHLFDRIKIPFAINPSGYTDYPFDIAFSKSGKYLYSTETISSLSEIKIQLCRYDLSAWDSAAIKNSRQVLFSPTYLYLFGLQLGPDDNLYFTRGDYLGVLKNSDDPNPVIIDSFINLSPGRNAGYLPKFASNLISNQKVDISYTVANDCRTVTLQAKTYIKGNTISFKWLYGDGDSIIQNVSSSGDTTYATVSHTYLPGIDSFNVQLTVTSDTVCGLAKAGAIVALQQPPPVANFGFAASCGSTNVLLTDSSQINFNTALSYQWSYKPAASPASFVNFSAATNPSYTFPAFDSFDVRLTISNSLSCVTDNSAVKRIYLKAKPNAAFTADNTCGSLSASFTNNSTVAADTIQTYSWDFGNGQTSNVKNPVFTFPSFGNKPVILTVTSSRGCNSDTLVQQVAIKNKPAVNIVAPKDSVCSGAAFAIGSSATLLGTDSIGSIGWSRDGAVFNGNLVVGQSLVTPANYMYRHWANTTQGCVSDTVFKNITVVGKPAATFTFVNDCGSLSVPFAAASSVINDAVVNHYWDFGDNSFSSLPNPVKNYATFFDSYTVKYAAVSSVGCSSDTVSQTVLVKDKPAAAINYNNNACANIPFSIAAIVSVNDGIISNKQWWVNDIAETINSNTLNLVKPAGEYTIKYVAVSDKGCASDTTIKNMIVDIQPQANAAIENGCAGKQVNFSSQLVAGNAAYHQWHFGNGDSSNMATGSHTYLQPGNYTATYVAISANGCISNTDSIAVSIESIPVADFLWSNPCVGQVSSLSAVASSNSFGPITNYSWLFNSAQTDSGISVTFPVPAAGSYNTQLTVSTANGCVAQKTETVEIGSVRVSAGEDASVLQNTTYTLQGSGATGYLWQPSSLLDNASAANPVAKLENDQLFIVEGTDANGCKSYDSVMIKVIGNIFIPNAFSPVGINKVWQIKNIENYKSVKLVVYNRYGQLVFEGSGANNYAWDGAFKNKPQPSGVYVYILQADDGRRVRAYKGTVMLVR